MAELNENDPIIDIESLNERFEEKGYFRRLIDMFKGLGMPKNTPQYKLARLELQRQQAPLIAIVSVVLLVVVLIVVTQMTKPPAQQIFVTQVEEEKPEEDEEVKEEPPPPDPPDITPPDITVDVPNPGPPSEMAPTPSPPSPQVSVSPAPVDSVHNVVSPVKMRSMVQSRHPGGIGEKTRGGAGYGDPTTEACVMKVLWWLKATQDPDGSWFRNSSGSRNKVANAALAVLTYLAHGEYPGSPSPYQKDFGPVVKKAVDFLISSIQQNSGGVRIAGSDGNEYAFLIATYALCEAYGMTKNPDVKDAALVCLERIVQNQASTGGWDYKLNKASDRDDVSFAGWAIQALKAGKMAGLHPEGLDECIKKAIRCLQTRNFSSGTFKYTASNNSHPGLAGVGCLAMQLLGYGSKKEVYESLNYMRGWKPSFEGADLPHNGKPASGNVCPQYYCYYATQCKYQAGMKEGASKVDQQTWYDWNKEMKVLFKSKIIDLDTKVKDWSGQEHKQGYYKNEDRYTSRPYMDSCLAALQLMVYYRYLPTTQTAAAKEDTAEADTSAQAVNSGDVGVDVGDF